MPCIIVGFYWLAKDICEANEKSGGFSSRRMVGIVRGECYFCPILVKTFTNSHSVHVLFYY
ncbi:hypothetical protein FG135_15170 [Vibrio cholerae]|nr:hypothetical protein [Vibrio cholerae]MDN6973516.1 hypothetical protein [Vibrio cholerae]MDN6986427.1 hypothetical protein [Vibrio cholerae]MDN6987577.1 hypothetical protein [Vibrio cholerae]MDN6999691.1 hypothetical protein [Vibrio cholerae]